MPATDARHRLRAPPARGRAGPGLLPGRPWLLDTLRRRLAAQLGGDKVAPPGVRVVALEV
jgi:hypothetical protein